MGERPILFSGEMVRAILEGRKTVTRRVVKPKKCRDSGVTLAACEIAGEINQKRDFSLCPYGQPGDRLWVREAHAFMPEPAYRRSTGIYQQINPTDSYEACIYRENFDRAGCFPWRPSIHMPRWASRILLEVTGVRVERLRDGEGETAFESRYLAEGLHRIHHGDGAFYYHALKSEPGPGNWCDPFDAWRELWCAVSGPGSWNANPWVWVVEFKVIEGVSSV